MVYGFKIVQDLCDGLSNFMDEKGYQNLEQLRGRAIGSITDWKELNLNHVDKAVIHQDACIQCGRCHVVCEDTSHQAITATKDGMPVYILLCPQLYDRTGNPYGDANGQDWPDNDVRFGRFASAAALLAAGKLDKNWSADLVHANDWPSALVPAYLAWNQIRIPTILTIHNLAYQGLFPRETLRRIGAPEDSFHIDGLEFYDKLSFLKGGLNYASHLTTVSETYAREITTPELGCGLEGLLRKRSNAAQLTGILNGIDESWDPRVCAERAHQLGADAPMPTASASNSGSRCRAGLFSVWSPGWCTRR
eukprot:gene37918-51203_t